MLNEKHIIQILIMCEKIYAKNFMLDYFPTNFVEKNDILYYIDFGCGKYTDDWNFENNGIYFLANTLGIAKFLKDGKYRDLVGNDGKPHKNGFENKVYINSLKKANRKYVFLELFIRFFGKKRGVFYGKI